MQEKEYMNRHRQKRDGMGDGCAGEETKRQGGAGEEGKDRAVWRQLVGHIEPIIRDHRSAAYQMNVKSESFFTCDLERIE